MPCTMHRPASPSSSPSQAYMDPRKPTRSVPQNTRLPRVRVPPPLEQLVPVRSRKERLEGRVVPRPVAALHEGLVAPGGVLVRGGARAGRARHARGDVVGEAAFQVAVVRAVRERGGRRRSGGYLQCDGRRGGYRGEREREDGREAHGVYCACVRGACEVAGGWLVGTKVLVVENLGWSSNRAGQPVPLLSLSSKGRERLSWALPSPAAAFI